MIALDTNVLVYARRQETKHHAPARDLIDSLATGDEPWGLPWPCVYEFLRVVTHLRVFDPPTLLGPALDGLLSLMDSSSIRMLGEGSTHAMHMVRMASIGDARGNLIHDAHIAALCLENGVTELWTADRDFARFTGLRIRNPFTEQAVHDSGRRYMAGI